MESAEEFTHAIIGIVRTVTIRNGQEWTPYDQIWQMLTARDAAIRAECAEKAQRALILLRAMVDMMEKQKLSHYVQDIFELTATWDDAECDGYCLYEEAKELLEDAAIMGEQ